MASETPKDTAPTSLQVAGQDDLRSEVNSPGSSGGAAGLPPTGTRDAPDRGQTTELDLGSTAADREKQASVFQEFLREYEAVDRTLGEDEVLRRVRQELHRLRRVAMRSHEHGRMLYDDYAKLYAEWFASVTRNKTGARAAVQDAQTITSLKDQIVAARERVRKCNADEDGILEQTRQVRYEVTQLENVLKQGVGLSVTQERTMTELRANHAMTTRELEQELEMISHLRTALNDIVEKIRSTDIEKRDIERQIFEIKEAHVRKKAEIDIELRTKERLEYDMRELRVVVGQKTAEVRAVQDQVNRANDDIGILEAQINSHRNSLERILNDQENLHVVMMKLQVDCDHQIAQTSQLYDENVKLASELQAREKELAKQKSEGKRINKIREGVMQKIAVFEQHKADAECERQALRDRMDSYVRDIEAQRRAIEAQRKLVDDARRELDLVKSGSRSRQVEARRLHFMSGVLETTRHNLDIEISRVGAEWKRYKKERRRITEERDGYVHDKMVIQANVVVLLGQIRSKETELFEYKKRTVHAETKLKHQHNLYEAVQSDRNLHSKHLVNAQAEIQEMKRELKIMNFQIGGFKEDITAKEAALARESAYHEKLTEDTDLINEEIKNLKHQSELAYAYIKAQANESMRLNHFAKEAEVERGRQETALKLLISERDNLSSQLMGQEKELARVYDLIKINASTIIKSEKQYTERMSTVRSLRSQILKLRKRKYELGTNTSRLNFVKMTMCHLQGELLREQARQKALEEELANPVNIHRWRRLDGSDPALLDNIQLLQTLQRRIILRTEELEEKEHLLADEERLYLQLRTMLNKQVGPEAQEQAREHKMVLKSKIRQYKHMGTELNMYRAQCKEARHAISQLNRGLADTKRRWFEAERAKISVFVIDRSGGIGSDSRRLRPRARQSSSASSSAVEHAESLRGEEIAVGQPPADESEAPPVAEADGSVLLATANAPAVAVV